ncbi:MAG: sterol-binding protein [Gammaproteobacteria bacterium]|nr:sterol-binding protein [Gammaproteobacteria bacterium]
MTSFSIKAPIHELIQKSLSNVVKNIFSPSKLGWLSTCFPKVINCMTTEKLINHTFAEQISDGDFDFLQSRLLQVEILDASLYVALSFDNNKIICSHFDSQSIEADVTLSIDTANAISLIQQEIDPDTLFFQRKLKINGDTELAHHVKNTIDTLDPEIIPSFVIKMIAEYKNRVLID